ncbi:MAG: hypothetical protein ACQEQL_02225 [Pseudomonadota bacterium]
MKTLSLKQVFDSISYTPAPLPPAESEVLDSDQAHKIITRFAAEDAAFFNFLTGLKPSRHLPTPLSYGEAQTCFNDFAHTLFLPEIELPARPRLKIKLDVDDISGRIKADKFLDLIKTALYCRDIVKEADSPSSDKVVDSLLGLSTNVAWAYDHGLKLSDRQFDQIKNLALPTNPVDAGLTDIRELRNIYVKHFQSATKPSKPMRRRGGIGPKLYL